MKKYLKDTWDTKTGLPGAQGKNGAAFVVEATNAQIKADTEVYTKNAVANGSFYAPPSIKSITDTAAVQATPLYRKVLATAGKDLTTAAPAPVIELAYAAAKTGVISYEEAAAGVSTFYRQAASINNTTKRFSQIGIQPQISFKVKPQIRQLEDVRGGETFDLTDHSQSLRMFTILKSRDTVGQLKSFFGGN